MINKLKKITVLFILFLLSSLSFSEEILEDFDNLKVWESFTFKNINNKSKYTIDKGVLVTPSDNSALDILKERYAKGEITKEEFESKKKIY